MPDSIVDEERFDLADMFAATDILTTANLNDPDLQRIADEAVKGSNWTRILERSLEGDIVHIYVVIDREPASGRWLLDSVDPEKNHFDELLSSAAEGKSGELIDEFGAVERASEETAPAIPIRCVDVGEVVIQAVAKLKKIETRGEKGRYSLRHVSRSAVAKKLAQRWPPV
jgi:hypothetical protein